MSTPPKESTGVMGPIRERARDELRQCETLITRLFDAHSQLLAGRVAKEGTVPSDLASRPMQIMEQLVAQQKSLRKLIDEVIEHQRLNSIIEELRKANTVEDAKIAHLGSNLRAAESVLQNALDVARPRLLALRRANKRPVDVDEVISYGSKISASMSAPPGWDPSQPLGAHLPPAPTEDMMRAGKLAALGLEDADKGGKG